jgi:glycosyltransferase involved in cell wall biosynthesis
MRIAQLAPLWERVPPPLYGGTELVVSLLTEELVRQGHDVTLFATGDSVTTAKLISVYPRPLYRDNIPWTNTTYNLLNIAHCTEMADKFDIIHSHLGYLSLYFSRLLSIPMVHTWHGSFDKKDKIRRTLPPVLQYFDQEPIVSISDSQRILPINNYISTVYNGIDINSFEYNAKAGTPLVWLGRVCDEKGTWEATQVAKQLGIPLILAGKVDYVNQKYFEEKIKPELGSLITFIGEVNHQQKVDLLKNAIALLNPIKWQEPFGLVMPEAMACGTPVIAFNRGSVPEIIVDGKTGYIVNTVEEMVSAVKKIHQIRREDCRHHVEDNFTVQRMVAGYLSVYERLLKRSIPQAHQEHQKSTHLPNE